MQRIEQVGVIPRALAKTLGVLQHGFTAIASRDQLEAIEREIVFADRPAAEEDPSRKQIIPYGVVCRGDHVFTVERLRGGAERRLHGKISIGIGGHVNPLEATATPKGLLRGTLERELAEELEASGALSARVVGFINDDTQPVGQVHLGVVYRVELEANGRASVREIDSLRGGFLPWPTLRALRRRMETWSTFVQEAYEAGLLA